VQRLRDVLAGLNPQLPTEVFDDVFQKLIRPEGTMLEARDPAFHRQLIDGGIVEDRHSEARRG